MHKFIGIALIASGLLAASLCEAKAKKLVTCENWLLYKAERTEIKAAPVYMCFDNEDKPFAMFDVQILERKVNGDTWRVAVGTK